MVAQVFVSNRVASGFAKVTRLRIMSPFLAEFCWIDELQKKSVSHMGTPMER